MREQFRNQRRAVKALLLLSVGALAGLIVGGTIHVLGTHNVNNAEAASTPKAPVVMPTPGAPLPEGSVVADQAAGSLSVEPALGQVHSPDGAAAAFTAYAVWLIGSPAALREPQQAAAAVGGTLINPTDATLVADMQRAPGDGFSASTGAYRILGHAGSQDAPDEVMVEVTAPLRIDAKTRWSTVGGVVTWTAKGWQLTSIRPTAVTQPRGSVTDVRAFSAKDRVGTLSGLGWRTFVPANKR